MPNSIPAERPKRGRPVMSPAQRAETKVRISKIARTLFQQEGFAKVSMRKIAKEFGCTPMTLYGYYGSKMDILRSLWGDVFEALFERLRAIPKGRKPVTYLQNLCIAYVGYWIENQDYYRLVFMAEGVTQPDVSLFLDNPEIVVYFNLFIDAIQALNGHNSSSQTKYKLDVLMSTMHGIAHNKITISGYGWTSPEDQIQYILKGIS